MPSNKEVLDALQREERITTIKGISRISIGVICALAIYYSLITYKETNVVYGYPKDIIDASSEYKARMLMIVDLEKGSSVKASFPSGILLRKNKKLKLLEIKTNFFGKCKYRVIEYIE